MAPLTLVANLATRWCHLHCLQIWPPDGTTCIDSKVGHQETSHRLPHCHGLPYWHYQLVLGWYHHQPESTQLSLTKVSEFVTSGPLDRTPGLPGSDKKVAQGESGPKGWSNSDLQTTSAFQANPSSQIGRPSRNVFSSSSPQTPPRSSRPANVCCLLFEEVGLPYLPEEKLSWQLLQQDWVNSYPDLQ